MSQRFLNALDADRVLLMDGAMGTELQRAGLPDGAGAAVWNLDHPDRVHAVHKAYVDAGAKVLVTNTFQAHPAALAERKAPASTERILSEGLRLAYQACAPSHFVLVSIGPFAAPGAQVDLDSSVLKSLGIALRNADGVLVETWSDPLCLEMAGGLRRQDSALMDQAILLSVTFQRLTPPGQGTVYRSLDCRHGPEWFAGRARDKGFAALGVNCGLDLELTDCAEILRLYRRETDLPLFARPNAGTPIRREKAWRFPLTPAAMSAAMVDLLRADAIMVGGCCGTTPSHIAACKSVVDAWNAQRVGK